MFVSELKQGGRRSRGEREGDRISSRICAELQ